jgi:excisionase family DNA binding protein
MAAHTPHRPAPRLLNLHAVASELDCSLDTIDRYIRKGQLPVIRLPSGRRRVAREDLDRAIEDWKADSR